MSPLLTFLVILLILVYIIRKYRIRVQWGWVRTPLSPAPIPTFMQVKAPMEESEVENGKTLQEAVREVLFRKRDEDEEIMLRGGSDQQFV
ncbi:MAG: hypothetical protein Q9183_001175 [Haloplaca sp. 2 TL-2023]